MASYAIHRPLVSIVTPVLNRAESIRVCLASVRSQSYGHIEHIVVDGGSTDGTLDVVAEFQAAYPNRNFRWITEPDKGMYDAINKGLRLATGDIVCYLNSDDLYLPWTVEVAVDALRSGTDLVFGDLAVLRHDREASGFYIQFYPDFDLPYYIHVATVGQPTVFWKRSLMEDVGYFNDGYRLIGDCEYWLRSAVSGAKIKHVDEVLAVQTEHEETLRATNVNRLKQEFVRMRSRYSSHADPPRWPRVQRVKKSLFWRKRQLQFRRELRDDSPERWSRFIGLLRRREIRIDDAVLLMFMLPERFRPMRSAWGDLGEFERQLMEEIGIDAGAV